jgi:hypothetical protein
MQYDMKFSLPLIALSLLLLTACNQPSTPTKDSNLKTFALNLITNAFEFFPFYHLHI